MPDSILSEETVIAANTDAVRRALTDLRGRLRGLGAEPERCDTAELVLAEVLNNVVEHAMTGRHDGLIRLTLATDVEWLVCEVQDNGSEMPGGALPCGAMATLGS